MAGQQLGTPGVDFPVITSFRAQAGDEAPGASIFVGRGKPFSLLWAIEGPYDRIILHGTPEKLTTASGTLELTAAKAMSLKLDVRHGGRAFEESVQVSLAPEVSSFGGKTLDGDDPDQDPRSLQVVVGHRVRLAWKTKVADSVELEDPAAGKRRLQATGSAVVKAGAAVQDYRLVAVAGRARSDAATVHVSTHPGDAVVSPHVEVESSAGSVAEVPAPGGQTVPGAAGKCEHCGQPYYYCKLRSDILGREKIVGKPSSGSTSPPPPPPWHPFMQTDKRWAAEPQFNGNGPLEKKGCHLTCGTMLAWFYGRKSPTTHGAPTPLEMNEFCKRYGTNYFLYPNGSNADPKLAWAKLTPRPNPRLIRSCYQHYIGTRCADPEKQHVVLDKIDQLLDNDTPVMVDVVPRSFGNPSWKTTPNQVGGHYIIVYGRDAAGRYLTIDPGWNRSYLDAPWPDSAKLSWYSAVAELLWFEGA
jgi:hypothetical protein